METTQSLLNLRTIVDHFQPWLDETMTEVMSFTESIRREEERLAAKNFLKYEAETNLKVQRLYSR